MKQFGKQNSAQIKIITAMVIFGTIGIVRKNIALSSSVVACARALIGTVFLLVISSIRKDKIDCKLVKKHALPLFLSGALLGANWICLFEAYTYTTVAVATICYYMAPVFMIVFAALLFRENLSRMQVGCVICAVLGMVLVSGVLETGFTGFRGIALGLIAAVMYAVIVLTNKKLGLLSGSTRTLFQLAIAAITLLIYVGLTENLAIANFDKQTIVMLLIAGILHTGIAYTLYFGSIQELPARTVALLGYIDPVLAVVLSVVFLKESMSVLNMIGILLVIGATMVSEIRQETE